MFGEKDVVRVAQECFVGKNRREVWRNGSFVFVLDRLARVKLKNFWWLKAVV